MKYIKHIIKEGCYEHVLYYDSHGVHCSCPECEINKNYDLVQLFKQTHPEFKNE